MTLFQNVLEVAEQFRRAGGHLHGFEVYDGGTDSVWMLKISDCGLVGGVLFVSAKKSLALQLFDKVASQYELISLRGKERKLWTAKLFEWVYGKGRLRVTSRLSAKDGPK